MHVHHRTHTWSNKKLIIHWSTCFWEETRQPGGNVMRRTCITPKRQLEKLELKPVTLELWGSDVLFCATMPPIEYRGLVLILKKKSFTENTTLLQMISFYMYYSFCAFSQSMPVVIKLTLYAKSADIHHIADRG